MLCYVLRVTATATAASPLETFWFGMEQLPADARAAPSASAPNDIVMDIASSPKKNLLLGSHGAPAR
eukprot:scaffold7734_cov146-Isochrysis_galbana.AAC.2